MSPILKLTIGAISLSRWTVSSQSYCVHIITYLKESFSKLNVLVYDGFCLLKKIRVWFIDLETLTLVISLVEMHSVGTQETVNIKNREN